MQIKLTKTRESPLESMGKIISSRCPIQVQFNESKESEYLSCHDFPCGCVLFTQKILGVINKP